MKAFLYRVCAIFFSHFVLYPDYRISFFIPLAFRFADYITLDYSVLEKFFPEEKENFSSLLNWENTREGTIALQCAIYMKFIGEIIEQYITFQEMLNGVLADLIILYEKQFQVDIEVDI